MMRFMGSTCGVFAELVVFDAAGPPLAIGFATLGVTMAAMVWWSDFSRLIDRLIGLDLQGPEIPSYQTGTD